MGVDRYFCFRRAPRVTLVERLDCVMELAEERLFVVVDNLMLINIEAVIKGLVEVAPNLGFGASVEGVRVFEQRQRVAQNRNAGRELLKSVDDPGFEALPLHLDGVQFGPDLCLRHGAVGCQVHQVIFSGFELVELSLERGVPLADIALLVVNGRLKLGPDLSDETFWKPEEPISFGDGMLHLLNAYMGQIAEFFLAGASTVSWSPTARSTAT